ncbi:hypothetical protein [Candidatus Cyanaurora vandensis]|uniref:hypothetical protein n=1 Tax=Candidatus Cyanaurora vandensis TaxID=2714958 RepID=UPI00257E84F0|nr:hypothetical protein [Candidatus Cyanaurora vandensis]
MGLFKLGVLGLLTLAAPVLATPYLVNSQTDQLVRTDVKTGKPSGRPLTLPIDDALHNVVETQTGLLVVGSGRQITLIDPISWQIQAVLPIPRAVQAQDTGPTPTLEAVASGPGVLFGLGYAANSNLVYAGITQVQGESFIYQIDPTAQTIRLLNTLAVLKPQDLVASADGLRVYISAQRYLPGPSAEVWSINPTSGVVSEPLGIAFDPLRPQLSLSADGNRLYLITADESILTVNTRTNRVVSRYRIERGQITRIQSDPDNRRLWISTRTPDQILQWDPLSESPPLVQDPKTTIARPIPQVELNTGVRRVLVGPRPVHKNVNGLQRVAVLGFEGELVPGAPLPDVAQVIAGDLMATRQYEIISPRQVASILQALDLSPAQVRTSPDVVRQVAQGLNADLLLVGEPLSLEIPDRTTDALLNFGAALLGIPLPLGQMNSPRIHAKARAFDAQGIVTWQTQVVNFDPGFLAGKNDLFLVNNGLIITAHDIANKFSNGAYERRQGQEDVPPLVERGDVLAKIQTIAILGPDDDLPSADPDRLGTLLAQELAAQLPWQVLPPDQSFARLQQLGIEPVQVLSTDPRLLASLLGVDAVCLGMVRGSTFYTGSIVSFGTGTSADVVIQYTIVDREGTLAWQDTQVANTPGFMADERTNAARKAVTLIVNKLKTALPSSTANKDRPERSN